MELRKAFAESLREIRHAHGVTQEHFDGVSSRTYISMLERGQRSPTLDKLMELATVLGVHPLSLLALTFSKMTKTKDPHVLLEKVSSELAKVAKVGKMKPA